MDEPADPSTPESPSTSHTTPARPPGTPITWLLIAANVAMFAVELANGVDAMKPTAQQVLALGGDFAPYTLNGQWWRLGSSMFLHYGVIHIAMNMIVLWQGRIVEVLYGRLGFIAIYVASGLLGGIASLWHAQWVVSAGASGAVFGVFGAFGAFLLMRRDQIDPAFLQRRAQSLFVFIGLNFYIGMTTKGIDMSAHIGGLLAGFIVGCVLAAGSHSAQQASKRAIGALVGALAVTVVALVVLPKPFDAPAELTAFGDVEKVCLDAYNDAQRKLAANTLTGADMVNVIEKQVLPPWRAARARLEGLHDIPERLAHSFELLDQYAKDREQSFLEDETLVSGSATHDFLKRHEDLQQKVKADLAAYDEAMK